MEVLVAVFVLALGLLGTATLQVTSKRANLEARERTAATLIAQDLIERMRANPRQLTVYTNNGVGWALTGSSLTAVSCAGGCTGAQIAAYDLYVVERAAYGIAEQLAGTAAAGLSAPTICVEGPAGGSGNYTVSIAWRGRTQLSNPATVDDCGEASGLYDTFDGTGIDVYRRVLTVATFIAEPV